MKRFKFGRKVAVMGVVTGLALAAGGVAFAYILATGSGPGNGTVGQSTSSHAKLTVSVTPCSGTATMLPGGSQTCHFVVHNPTTAVVHIGTATVTLTSTGGNIVQTVSGTKTAVSGCLASWFTASVTTQPSSTHIAANGGTDSGGVVTLSLATKGTAVAQTSCLGTKPLFIVHVAS
jgi:hypothetical protein